MIIQFIVMSYYYTIYYVNSFTYVSRLKATMKLESVYTLDPDLFVLTLWQL